MSDLFSPLREPEHVSVPPVDAVRRRGETLRRRRAAMAAGAVATLVATVAVTGAMVTAQTSDRSSEPPVATQSPTPTPEPEPVTRIPADIDLGEGLEDPGSDGQVREGPAVRWLADVVVCDTAYSPADSASDHAAVLWQVPQMSVGRDLRAYDDDTGAVAAATDLVEKFRSCPTFSPDGGVSLTTNQVRSLESGGNAWLVTQTYTTDDLPQLGQSILVIEQVGNTVLVAQSYSEGPGSTDPPAMMRAAREFVSSLEGVRYRVACGFELAACS